MSHQPFGDLASLEAYLEAKVRGLTEGYPRRHVWNPEGLDGAAAYVQAELEAAGLPVQTEPYQACFWRNAQREVGTHRCRNLIVDFPGQAHPERVLIVGAHYDSRVGMASQQGTVPCFEWEGQPAAVREFQDTPGANDNGSGIATLLALAHGLRQSRLPITVRLVAWANEEYPFFRNGWAEADKAGAEFFAEGMGSYHHAKQLSAGDEQICGAIALDTLGTYRARDADALDAQSWLRRLAMRALFPKTGDYVAFMSNRDSRGFLKQVHRAYAKNGTVRGITRAFPTMGRGWSDDWAYWQFDIPGLIVTDTAYVRSRHYHRVSDTADRLTYGPFAEVVWALRSTIEQVAAELG